MAEEEIVYVDREGTELSNVKIVVSMAPLGEYSIVKSMDANEQDPVERVKNEDMTLLNAVSSMLYAPGVMVVALNV
jgi:hypothetical protein